MPVYQIPMSPLLFPRLELAEPDGLLAVGGDLSPERLLLAYSVGVFPWFNEEDPILWWSPDPRYIIYPENIHVSRSLRKFWKKTPYRVTFDHDFKGLIRACAYTREGETWLSDEMKEAYIGLHNLGFAHSVEVWNGDQLAGGLYGVSIGSCFFGESMVSIMENASKTAMVALSRAMVRRSMDFIDCQVRTEHLVSMGAEGIPRTEFQKQLSSGTAKHTFRGSWCNWEDYTAGVNL